jgi:putative hydrolase of HD superfamily
MDAEQSDQRREEYADGVSGDRLMLLQQLAFLKEIDRPKAVVRQSPLLDRSRKENSAEHSWHLAMYAWLLEDQAGEHIDLFRVMQMLLLHDVVGIDASDTPLHGGHSRDD